MLMPFTVAGVAVVPASSAFVDTSHTDCAAPSADSVVAGGEHVADSRDARPAHDSRHPLPARRTNPLGVCSQPEQRPLIVGCSVCRHHWSSTPMPISGVALAERTS